VPWLFEAVHGRARQADVLTSSRLVESGREPQQLLNIALASTTLNRRLLSLLTDVGFSWYKLSLPGLGTVPVLSLTILVRRRTEGSLSAVCQRERGCEWVWVSGCVREAVNPTNPQLLLCSSATAPLPAHLIRVSLARHRVTSLITNRHPPQDHHRALGIGLLQGPRAVRFRVSEVTLHVMHARRFLPDHAWGVRVGIHSHHKRC